MPETTRAAHDALLARILAPGAVTHKAALRRELAALTGLSDYPDGLAGYYRHRIDTFCPSPPNAAPSRSS